MLLTSRASLEEAVATLAPLQQGGLDGLCGLYAVINAIRLVIHPARTLRKPQLRRLFDAGLATLSRARKLRPVITSGMSRLLWLRVCEDVVHEARIITGLELFVEQLYADDCPIIPPVAFRRIRRSLHGGSPVLATLLDSYNHISVIVGYSPARLTLFDSAGSRWVNARAVSFDWQDVGNAHYIPPDSLVALLAY